MIRLGLITLGLFAMQVVLGSEAIDAFNKEQYDKAAELFSKQLKQPDKKNQALIYLSRIAIQNNQLDDAEDYLNKAIKVEPNDANEFYWYGAMSGMQAANASIFTAGSYAADAREYFNKAITLEPTHIDALKGLANFYLQAPAIVGGDIDKAWQTIEKLKAVSSIEGDLMELTVHNNRKETEKSLAKAKQIGNDYPNSARALYNAGLTLQSQQKFDIAVRLLSTASRLTPVDEREQAFTHYALYQVGRTAVFSGDNIDGGIQAFKQYLKVDLPENSPSKHWAKYRLINLLEKQKDNAAITTLLSELKGEKVIEKDLLQKLQPLFERYGI